MRASYCVVALCGSFLFSSVTAAEIDSQQAPPDQFTQEKQVCEGELGGAHAVSAEAKIKACSDLLSSGQLTARGQSFVLVNRSLAQKADDLAAADLDAAMKADPTFDFAWAQSCSFHTWHKDLARATQECTKAIDLAPNNASGWTYRGDIYLVSKSFEKAISDYDRAIQLDGKWMWPWDNRGEAYLRSGNLDRAIHDFEMVIKLNPDYAMGYIDRGIARIKQRQLESALSDFEEGLKIDPNCASCLYGRGVVKGLRSDKIGQAADIKAARAMNPNASDNFDEDGISPD